MTRKPQTKSSSSELPEAALALDNLAAGGGSRVSEAQHSVRREDGQRRADGDQVTLVPRATCHVPRDASQCLSWSPFQDRDASGGRGGDDQCVRE